MEDRVTERYSLASYILGGWLLVFLGWWLFALVPLPEASPGWIEAARRVCFGSLPSGLPEGYGWLTLVGSPLLMLTALVLTWPAELASDLKRAQASASGRGLLFAFGAATLLILGWGGMRIHQVKQAYERSLEPITSETALPESYPRVEYDAPPFTLINQHGEMISLRSLKGRPYILTFAFAHCASICPGLVHNVLKAARSSEGDGAGVVIVTLDPWRDTPGSLPTMARQWQLGEHEYVLSGPVEEVLAVAEAYQVPASRDLTNGEIVHPGMAFVFNSQGTLVYQFNSPSTDWLIEALNRSQVRTP